MKIERHANYRRYKETDSPASTSLFQDLLQVRRQEPHIFDALPQVSQRPDEAQKQDAWRQEVNSSTSYLNAPALLIYSSRRVHPRVSWFFIDSCERENPWH
jgi:hypothetical protein